MPKKAFLKTLGFVPKEGSSGIFRKDYPTGYSIEVDFEKEKFDFGKKIRSESQTTQNFSQEENWVVLECVDRLLEKGYRPEDIVLEKIYPTGHGTSGRLDILVEKNGKAFLMIECKTWGKEFEKEHHKIQKDGGQLFTYFQQDTKTDFLILYASTIGKDSFDFKNTIIKIEDHYRDAGNITDFYDRWNKIPTSNGIFENWVKPYCYESKALTKGELKHLAESDSSFIFHEFLSILRKHSVSDKPNAFNKIFNLFLCKIFDEKKKDSDELDFQWKEGMDNHVRFQLRLINLYKEGMLEFLRKEVEGISDNDFHYKTPEELEEKKKKWLKFNNVFAIKEVIDDETFEDNARVLKEVVELLQQYKIRYPRKQQHLSNFFERLLTTGLKQESGQYFTPPPVTRFIIKSLPIKRSIEEKLKLGNSQDLIPAIIDYAAGSGHFLTEAMEEVQKTIDEVEEKDLYDDVIRQIKSWKIDQFNWASKYIYGIEKDYRLVKVAKVGCYFYGDGLAQIIHGDGLDSFEHSKNYIGLLKNNAKKAQFDFVISNPPYSVSSFKADMKNDAPSKEFGLYQYLTDRSSEIECLFVERTGKLLKEGGIAAIILPSSILSNTGIYTKTREILLKNFEFIAFAEFGSGTFMATGTNTVTLFLRRRNDSDWERVNSSVEKFFSDMKDVTVNKVEKLFSKYVTHAWKGLSFEDYKKLCEKKPSSLLEKHPIFIDYIKKLKAGKKDEVLNRIIEIEKEKICYFALAYAQKVVLVKSGEKEDEKSFLGYEFSNRRGGEGMHPFVRGKNIDDCTKLFDPKQQENPEKASTYIFQAFNGNFDAEIHESLDAHISRINLIDTLSFEKIDFDKAISLNVKKKIKVTSKWDFVSLGDNVGFKQKSKRPASYGKKTGKYPFYTSSSIQEKWVDNFDYEEEAIIVGDGGNSSIFISEGFSASDHNFVFSSKNPNLENKYIYYFYKNHFELITSGLKGHGLRNISKSYLESLEIPLPSPEIQRALINEMIEIDKLERDHAEKIKSLEGEVKKIVDDLSFDKEALGNIVSFKNGLNYNKNSIGEVVKVVGVKDFQNNFSPDLDTLEDIQIEGELSNDYSLKENDILVVRSNGSANLVGRFLLIGTLRRKTSFSGFTIRIRPDISRVTPKYLCHYLRSDKIRGGLEKSSSGSNIKSLNQGLLSSLQIPLPPIPKQEEVIIKIKGIEDKISYHNQQLLGLAKNRKDILKKYL